MGDLKFWRILRVLTTNTCNYDCTFCHNEGQERKQIKKQLLKFNDYKVILDSFIDSQLQEVQFSGGEPFINSDLLKMILYTNDKTSLDIGCATNASFLNEDIVKQLSKTRIKLNIQFPSIERVEFKRITKTGEFDLIMDTLYLLKRYKVDFGINHVVTQSNWEHVFSTINFALIHEIPLKLLPDLSDKNIINRKDEVLRYLDSISVKRIDKGTGAIKWWVRSSNFQETQVIYIDSPCFYLDFNLCKNFAEIRLLPNKKLQSCIKKGVITELDFEINEKNRVLIRNKFQEAWNSFISC